MSKKRKAPPRTAKKDPYSTDQLLTSSKSRLIDVNLHAKLSRFFSDPSNWAQVPDADKDFIRTLLPPGVELEDDGSVPSDFWKYNTEFRLDCRNLQEDLRAGRMDPEWQRQAAQAMKERAAGHFDDFKEKEFEEYWGQKQKVDWNVLAGEASKVRLQELLKEGLFRVGDVWSFDHTFGKGDQAIRVEKECKIVDIDGKSVTLAIPPGQRRFAQRLVDRGSAPENEVTATPLPATATAAPMIADAGISIQMAPRTNGDTDLKDDSIPTGRSSAITQSSNTTSGPLDLPATAPLDEQDTASHVRELLDGDARDATPRCYSPEKASQHPADSPTKSSVLSEPPPSSQDVPVSTQPTSGTSSDPLSAATEYDVILHTTTGLYDLEKQILKIDGRAKPGSRSASTWRDIRCRRNEQDLGSLFEMRDEYYAFKVHKGDYRPPRRSGSSD